MAKKQKDKVIPVTVIPRCDEATGEVCEPYRIMEEILAEHHDHLAEAKIALAWHAGWKQDKDNRLKLGQCRKATDLDRELHDYDFVILLNQIVWNQADFGEAQRRALIDHELCHAAVSYDSMGEERRDSSGRIVYRIRGHDIEEFGEIVKRHGLYKSDLESFAFVCLQKTKTPLLKDGEAKAV